MLVNKYNTTKLSELKFNKQILEELAYIAMHDDIPHIIISGPKGGGKKTLVKFLLEAMYDDTVNILSKHTYTVSGSSAKTNIDILQSDNHIIIEPASTNHDKYILQEIIKQYASQKNFNFFAQNNRKFKTILIYNIENLSVNSQAALRRTMEMYAKTCRFIMICNNLSKIFDPLRSRCRIFCVPLPSISTVMSIQEDILTEEKIELSDTDKKYIRDNSRNDIKKIMWIDDMVSLDMGLRLPLENSFDKVVKLILSCANPKQTDGKKKNMLDIFNNDIRNEVYNLLITNIKGSDIITKLLNMFIEKINNPRVCHNIIKAASDAEYNMIYGRRDIMHIDYFLIAVMKELYNNRELRIDQH